VNCIKVYEIGEDKLQVVGAYIESVSFF